MIHYIFSSESLRVVNSLQIVNSLRVLFLVCRGPLGFAGFRNLAHRNRSDFCDLRLRCPSRTPEIAAISETRESNAALRFKGAMEKPSDLRFRAAISEPKTPSFCGISSGLAPSKRKSLAIAIVRFWCAKSPSCAPVWSRAFWVLFFASLCLGKGHRDPRDHFRRGGGALSAPSGPFFTHTHTHTFFLLFPRPRFFFVAGLRGLVESLTRRPLESHDEFPFVLQNQTPPPANLIVQKGEMLCIFSPDSVGEFCPLLFRSSALFCVCVCVLHAWGFCARKWTW